MPSDANNQPSFRLIVVGIVQNECDEYLICKMPKGRGVLSGEWGLPGGGVEQGERMEAALRRELMEELAIDVTDIKPLFFSDGTYNKLFANGDQRDVYMIFLIFSCRAKSTDITLSAEFSEYAWIRKDDLNSYDLNSASIITFQRAGVL